jgi:hypothetical protein
MNRIAIALTLALLLLGSAPVQPAVAQGAPPALTEQEARAIAVDSYVYLYPFISMDVTRKQLINSPPGTGIGGPMNAFVNIPTFPTADMKAVVRPNFDTLYSSGWLESHQGAHGALGA